MEKYAISGKHRCLYDLNKPYAGLCDVCRVFGTTGWSRRFRLALYQDGLRSKMPAAASIDTSERRVFTLSNNHPDRHTQGHKWYLSGDPLYGQVTLGIIPTTVIDEASNALFDPTVIGALIQLIADRASIGAKPQMGLGVVDVVDRQSTQPLVDHLAQIIAVHQKNRDLITRVDDELPCLQNMFFAKVNVHSTLESATFDLKYGLRNLLRDEFKDDRLRHTIMGYVRGGKRDGAKIMMSYPYENEIVRIWGWIPKLAQLEPSRDKILEKIYYDFLEPIYGAEDQISFWLDFDPRRNGSVLEYLEKYLLVGVE